MKRMTRGLLMIVAGIGVLTAMPAVAQNTSSSGAVFIMTNAADKNQVIAYSRDSRGKLTDPDGGQR